MGNQNRNNKKSRKITPSQIDRQFTSDEIESALLVLQPTTEQVSLSRQLQKRLSLLRLSIDEINGKGNSVPKATTLTSFLWELAQVNDFTVEAICNVLQIQRLDDIVQVPTTRLTSFFRRIELKMEIARTWIHYHFAVQQGLQIASVRARGGQTQDFDQIISAFETTYDSRQQENLQNLLHELEMMYKQD